MIIQSCNNLTNLFREERRWKCNLLVFLGNYDTDQGEPTNRRTLQTIIYLMGMIEFQVYNEKMKESRTIYSHEVSKGSLCRCGMLIFLCASGILALPSLLYPFPSFPLPLSTYFFPIICLGKEIKENQFTHTQLNHLALALALALYL